ncbi:LUD domain-containing protein [Streptomyces roseirectus]|uniref:LUD domain-containing protein n=1 Tax=Streptomyces roseirectus TaxID=2768066 RepID=A0A7H0IG83_9ACTN|nr:LUD domain-containing protein [Streptomyces roseirectus]QNP71799.1 LUD domain-containing protein [Streptomyces roseirectus]
MNDFQAVADRVEIEALRAEFTDAAMMRDRARLAALFLPDGVLRMPNIPVEQVGRAEILAGGELLQRQWDFFVQNTHPGTVVLDGDTATGRAYIHEIARALDGRQGINYAVYHDRYQRTEEGWRFAEREYEVRYLDTSPLTGAAPETDDGGPDFGAPASDARLERTATALRGNGFDVEILDDVAAARARVKELLPEGAGVLTGASETLRLSGIDEDINATGRYDAVRPRLLALDRAAQGDEFRRLLASPDYVVNSVAAVTETGSLVLASGSGSQLPANAGGAGHRVWIIGAQKVVPDLPTALRRVEEHALPLENVRARAAYGQDSAVNRLLILNAEPQAGRGRVLLLREAVGY